jgi:hypothetical protein
MKHRKPWRFAILFPCGGTVLQWSHCGESSDSCCHSYIAPGQVVQAEPGATIYMEAGVEMYTHCDGQGFCLWATGQNFSGLSLPFKGLCTLEVLCASEVNTFQGDSFCFEGLCLEESCLRSARTANVTVEFSRRVLI